MLDADPYHALLYHGLFLNIACGTGGMLDQCRQEVESLRAVSTASVTFIEEASTR